MVSRSWPNNAAAYLVLNGLPVRPWVTIIPRSKRPEHTRMNATRSRWAGSMLAATLNTNPENGAPSGRRSPSAVSRGSGGGTRSTTASNSLPMPKLVSAEPKNVGVEVLVRKPFRSRSAPTSLSSDSSSWATCHAGPSSTAARSAGTASSGAMWAPRAVRAKRVYAPSRRSTTPRKSPA
jgi:hypothetical protein